MTTKQKQDDEAVLRSIWEEWNDPDVDASVTVARLNGAETETGSEAQQKRPKRLT